MKKKKYFKIKLPDAFFLSNIQTWSNELKTAEIVTFEYECSSVNVTSRQLLFYIYLKALRHTVHTWKLSGSMLYWDFSLFVNASPLHNLYKEM